MLAALIKSDFSEIVKIYHNKPIHINISGKWQAYDVEIGYETPDKKYKVVKVIPFNLPDGYKLVGDASYLFNVNKEVAEVFSIEELPKPAKPEKLSQTTLARIALYKTDDVAIRCFKAGIAFPDDWKNYTETLRAIVKSNSGELPRQPDYPEGS